MIEWIHNYFINFNLSLREEKDEKDGVRKTSFYKQPASGWTRGNREHGISHRGFEE